MKLPAKSVEGTENKNLAILGTYEGECADSNITNLNGLDITRPVWENVFNSEDYKKAIELGHYIGYLGHPEDPNCMDFKDACIVMTEGHIDDNGKVYGKFNLIDTPVGRIVKTFQDAGVTFGISVRGAGDIENNSVDPETFIFRGFDLVTFPAFPESIPKFVAASSDAESQAKYKKICAAVNSNLQNITSSEALKIIQSQFAEQSDEYRNIEARISELGDEVEDISDEKIQAVTALYLESIEANNQLKAKIASMERAYSSEIVKHRRKIASLERICLSQSIKMQEAIRASEIRVKTAVSASSKLKKSLLSARENNLKYIQKIDASKKDVEEKTSVISSLQSKLSKTVTAAENDKRRSSNLDEKLTRLTSEISACKKMLAEYQDAYANLYSSALGVDLKNITVTATTSVDELQRSISGTVNASLDDAFAEPMHVDAYEDYDDEIVTL